MQLALTLAALLPLSSALAQVEVLDNTALKEGPPFRLRTESQYVAEWTPRGGSTIMVGEGRDGFFFPDFADIHVSEPDGNISTIPVATGFPMRLDAAWDAQGVLWSTHSDFGGLILRRHGTDGDQDQELDVPNPPEAGNQNAQLVDFFLGEDGRLHAVLWLLSFDSSTSQFRRLLFWGTQDGAEFPIRYLGQQSSSDIAAAAVDAQGRLLTLESRVGAHEFSRDLVLARHDQGGRTEETVHAAPEMDFFPVEGAMVLNPDGTISIAARYVKTVVTGSPVYSRVDFFERGNSGWERDTLVTRSDGYRGSDGDQYTGASIMLRGDQRGGLHMVFCDIANWHQGGFSRATSGQVRYGYRHPGEDFWEFRTLLQQPGQTQSSNPLHAFQMAGMAVSPGGSMIHIYGEETRSTDPPQHPGTAVSASWLRRLRVANDRGQELPVAAAELIAILLQRNGAPAPVPSHEQNGDQVLDAADLHRVRL